MYQVRILTSAGICLANLAVAATTFAIDATPADDAGRTRTALVATLEGPIGPGAVRHVAQAIAAAGERDAELLIFRIDTPGGLATSMREIIVAILASPVPVAGYVAPPGAHAASAGTYILYATHVAAMAPGTNLGAATPVSIGGLPGLPGERPKEPGGTPATPGDTPATPGGAGAPRPGPDDPMAAKAVNDAVAFIRSLAELHGRNADWAEQAVREAASLSATRALELDVVDLVAADVAELLAKSDGRTVTAGSRTRTLATAGAAVEPFEADWLSRALGLLSNPNVAFLLMMIGIYGLIFEFANPGTIGPGVAGVICLLLGLYALNQLPLDYAGAALLVIGIAFMVAEAVTPSFGALGLGGLVAFVLGAAMLVDTDHPAFRLSWWVIGGAAAMSAAVLVVLLGYVWRVYRRLPDRGAAGGGDDARVLDWNGDAGHVWARGERWSARGAPDLRPDQIVRVIGMDGLTLVVGPREPPARADRPDEGG